MRGVACRRHDSILLSILPFRINLTPPPPQKQESAKANADVSGNLKVKALVTPFIFTFLVECLR